MPSKYDKNFSESSDMRYLYEYAVIQFVPSIERDECVNVGLVMMCKRLGKVWMRFYLDLQRLGVMFPDADIEALGRQLTGFERVAKGDVSSGGPIASLEPHERFRWLTAVRSASLRTPRPHGGLSSTPDATFEKLFESLVL